MVFLPDQNMTTKTVTKTKRQLPFDQEQDSVAQDDDVPKKKPAKKRAPKKKLEDDEENEAVNETPKKKAKGERVNPLKSAGKEETVILPKEEIEAGEEANRAILDVLGALGKVTLSLHRLSKQTAMGSRLLLTSRLLQR
jgi:hypothetical protein